MVNLRLRSLISLLLAATSITSCNRYEGVVNVGGVTKAEIVGGIPSQIPVAALDEIIAYFESLNLALDSGDISSFKSGRFDSCGCLVIAENISSLWEKSNLIGGDYLVREIAPLRIGATALQIKVLVLRTEVLKIDRSTGSVESWPEKEIATNFSLDKKGGRWLMTGSSAG